MTQICIDGFNLALPKGTGIATYGRNLLDNINLIELETAVLYGPNGNSSSDPVIQEAALLDGIRRKPSRRDKAVRKFRTATMRFGRTALPLGAADHVVWPGRSKPKARDFWTSPSLFPLAHRAFQRHRVMTPLSFPRSDGSRPDLMHWTCPLPVFARGMPNIYTFHDLIPLRLPYVTTDDKQAFLDLCRKVVGKADHICVVSEATRRDVERILQVPADRITNTGQAVYLPTSITERPQQDIEIELENIFNLSWKGYFLHFGAIEPKKNLGRIVQAYLASGVKTPLILVGSPAWMHENETALLKRVLAEEGPGAGLIRQYEYLPGDLLFSLIRGAKATLFPSLYEGFGLPVLESMALGTAVLTSNAGSLPEVAGDAAIMVDPYDVQAMTNSIRTLDADADLCRHLSGLGHEQASRFSVRNYQDQLRSLYAKVGIAP